MPVLDRRQFLTAAASAAVASAATRPPNVVMIYCDDLGYGDLGCYGQQTIQTPNLDRMAAGGMIFTDHYSGTCVCAPSRCSLMTGFHTGHTYIRGNSEVQPMGQLPLPAETVTLPKLLKQAGYTTALIGKWGLGGPDSTGTPNRQGFDYFFGYLCQRHAHNYYPEFLFRNDERVPLGNEVKPVNPPSGVATRRVQYSDDLFSAAAFDFIKRNRRRPFFLYLAYTIPHANNEAGNDGMEVPSYGPYANEDWPRPQKGYAAMITRMDADIGKLFARLKALGLDEKTLVLFSSDNGPHKEGGADPEFFDSSGDLRGQKRDLYDRLKDDIDKSRATYQKRYGSTAAAASRRRWRRGRQSESRPRPGANSLCGASYRGLLRRQAHWFRLVSPRSWAWQRRRLTARPSIGQLRSAAMNPGRWLLRLSSWHLAKRACAGACFSPPSRRASSEARCVSTSPGRTFAWLICAPPCGKGCAARRSWMGRGLPASWRGHIAAYGKTGAGRPMPMNAFSRISPIGGEGTLKSLLPVIVKR